MNSGGTSYKDKLLHRLGTSQDPADRALHLAVLEIWDIVEAETNHVEANTEPVYQRIWETLNPVRKEPPMQTAP